MSVNIGTLTGQIRIEDGLTSATMVAQRALDGLVKSVGLTSAAFAGLGAAAVAAGVAIVKMAEHGADVADISEQFTFLAQKAGVDSVKALEELRKGTANTVSDMKLMQTSLTMLRMGFSGSAEDMGMVAQASRVLAEGGMDLEQAFSMISRALTTGQPRLLARLGINIDLKAATDKYKDALEEEGQVADDVSMKHAKSAAILDGLKNYVNQSIKVTDDFKDKTTQASVAIENFNNKLAQAVSESPKVNDAVDRMKAAFVRAFGGDQQKLIDNYVRIIERIAEKVGDLGVAVLDMGGKTVQAIKDSLAWWDKLPKGVKDTTIEVASLTAGVWALSYALGAVAASPLVAVGGKLVSHLGDMLRLIKVMGVGGALLIFQNAWASMAGVVVAHPFVAAAIAIGGLSIALKELAGISFSNQLMTLMDWVSKGPGYAISAAQGRKFAEQNPKMVEPPLTNVLPFALSNFPEPGPAIKPPNVASEEAKKRLEEQRQAILNIYGATVQLTAAQKEQVKFATMLGGSQSDIVTAYNLSAAAVGNFLQGHITDAQHVVNGQNEIAKSSDIMLEQFKNLRNQSPGLVFDKLAGIIPNLASKVLAGSAGFVELTRGITQTVDEFGKYVDVSFAVYDETGKMTRAWDAAGNRIVMLGQKTKLTMGDLWQSVSSTLGTIFQDINSKAGQVFQSVAHIGDAFKGINASMQENISNGMDVVVAKSYAAGEKIVAVFAAVASVVSSIFSGKTGKGASAAVGSASGAAAGAGLGFLLSGGNPIGAGIGAAIGGVVGAIGGWISAQNKAREANIAATAEITKMHAELVKTYGSMQNLTTIGKVMGIEIPSAMERGTQGLEHFKTILDAFNEKMELLNSAMQEFGLTSADLGDEMRQMYATMAGEDLVEKFNALVGAGVNVDKVTKNMSGAMSAYIAEAVKTGTKIPAAMQPMLEKMLRMGTITREAANALLGLTTGNVVSFADASAAAERYGYKIEELGAKAQQLKIDEIAKQVVLDWQTFKDLGVDPAFLATTQFGKSVQDLVTEAMKYGAELPESLKPMLEAMIDAGTLTDDAGQEMKDLSKLTFAKDLSKMFDELIVKLDELIDKITIGVGGALSGLGNNVPDIDIPLDRPPWEEGTSGAAVRAAQTSAESGGRPIVLNNIMQVGQQQVAKSLVTLGRAKGWLR